MAQLVFAVVELMRGNVLLISIFCLRKRFGLGAGTAGLSCATLQLIWASMLQALMLALTGVAAWPFALD